MEAGCQPVLQMPLVHLVVRAAVRYSHGCENVVHFRLPVASGHHRSHSKVYLELVARFRAVHPLQSPVICDLAAIVTFNCQLEGKSIITVPSYDRCMSATHTAA